MDTSMNSAINATIPLLTNCLKDNCSASTLDALHVVLMSSLSAHLAPTWNTERPTLGASSRALRLTPSAQPPRPLRVAAQSTGINAAEWVHLLTGGEECEICVDPGMVSYRVGEDTPKVYWQGIVNRKTVSSPWEKGTVSSTSVGRRLQTTGDDNWLASVLSLFPETPRSGTPISRPSRGVSARPSSVASSSTDSPLSITMDLPRTGTAPQSQFLNPGRFASHSRTNSTSSTGTGATGAPSSVYGTLSLSMSQLSLHSSSTSATSPSSVVPSTRSSSPVDDTCCYYEDEEEGNSAAVCYIDKSRRDVTEYECGKVGVLGGAVMLGVPRNGVASAIKVVPAKV
ncbi:uncharacterized protein EI90DRAFT_1982515 [Cantharellus anzutake]|uniref:uncharacterized protein n=1 Tax=Cantharellus anzutake TaxID=1750568 RepID=UPI001904825F|nr:uncharacterized protein EI90DRAFT_1982515 [Cantharellus anzutake]KAF8326019.1 hypothetical protein EI90DRAFT_1982515 [Cantharellus anzutake]